VQARINGLRGGGEPLPASQRAFFEPRFGYDFSQVRVHTGAHAAESARAVKAMAYTVGQDLVFNQGQYAPESQDGKRLLAHELTHVVQQKNERGLQRFPVRPVDPIHDPLLDEFSRDTGIPRDTATQHDPAYAAWLSVRSLDRLTVEELLATLTSLEARGQLDTLITNSGVVSSPRYQRVMTAMQVVRQSRGVGANPQTALAMIAASGLPAAEQLAMVHYVRVPATHGADQRRAIAPGGAAALPNADLAREIGYELDPSSRPAPAPPVPAGPPGAPPPPPPPPPARIKWDGRTDAPDPAVAAAARATMQAELFTAYDAYLTEKRRQTLDILARPRVAFTAPAAAVAAAPAPTGVVDIANQARAVLETRYATTMDTAATTPAQLRARGPLQGSGPGQNLFDSSSEADRITLTGDPNLARGIAWWLFENDRPPVKAPAAPGMAPGVAGAAGRRRFATEILADHHYSTQDPGATQYRWDVADAYVAASTLVPSNRRQLIDYRMTVSEADPTGSGKGFTAQSAFNPGTDRNRAELVQRWTIFQTATHESLHLRTHPAFVAARQGRGTMMEGFVEMFTIATLNTDVLPRVRAGSVEPLRRTVEGALSPATPDVTIITNRDTPAQYVGHRAQAERIRDGGTPAGGAAHAGVGEAAVRAAFFQGHVEYLGLAPAGSQLTTLPVAGVAAPARIPGGIAGLDDLAWRSGVPRATIERDNPGITDALPAAAALAGCREHWVVAGETRAKIAAQNGVSEADLVRANPDIPLDAATSAWPALAAGQKILIPAH
jgi:hypothetical protein